MEGGRAHCWCMHHASLAVLNFAGLIRPRAAHGEAGSNMLMSLIWWSNPSSVPAALFPELTCVRSSVYHAGWPPKKICMLRLQEMPALTCRLCVASFKQSLPLPSSFSLLPGGLSKRQQRVKQRMEEARRKGKEINEGDPDASRAENLMTGLRQGELREQCAAGQVCSRGLSDAMPPASQLNCQTVHTADMLVACLACLSDIFLAFQLELCCAPLPPTRP